MLTPGFIGKIPSQGDFVHRRLPWEFIDAWDAWMQDSIGATRERLGENWLDYYLVAPVWRFLLTAGSCDNNAWLGLWFPSVDRVGRHFPMTIAVPLPAQRAHPALLLKLEDWLAGLEETALAALDPRMSLEQLDSNLVSQACEIPLDTPLTSSAMHTGTTQVHVIGNPYNPNTLATLLNADPAKGRATAYWHTWGTDCIASTLLISERLLDPASFAACLTGDWRGNGLTPTVHA